MLEIKSTTKGYSSNQEISLKLFGQIAYAVVGAICEIPIIQILIHWKTQYVVI